MNQNDLYSFAEENNITVAEFPLKKTLSLAIMDTDNDCYIAMDSKRMKSTVEKNERLIHELGHCMTGSFYSRHTPLITRSKCEYRANKWAIENYIPFEDFKEAIRRGCNNYEELAEHFDVTPEMIGKAYTYYTETCGLALFEDEN